MSTYVSCLTRSLYVYLYHPRDPALPPCQVSYMLVFCIKSKYLCLRISPKGPYISPFVHFINICFLRKKNLVLIVSMSTYNIHQFLKVSLGPCTLLDIAMHSGFHKDAVWGITGTQHFSDKTVVF